MINTTENRSVPHRSDRKIFRLLRGAPDRSVPLFLNLTLRSYP